MDTANHVQQLRIFSNDVGPDRRAPEMIPGGPYWKPFPALWCYFCLGLTWLKSLSETDFANHLCNNLWMVILRLKKHLERDIYVYVYIYMCVWWHNMELLFGSLTWFSWITTFGLIPPFAGATEQTSSYIITMTGMNPSYPSCVSGQITINFKS